MPTKKRSSITDTIPSAPTPAPVLAASALLVDVDPQQIDPHPRNPRRDLGDLTELAASIAAHGIRQPLTVVPHPDDPTRFRAVIGHRRRAAAIEAGMATVPVLIDTVLDEAGQLELMLLENLQRIDLNVIEEGSGYQGLLDLGVTQARIAKETGRHASTVAQRVKVASLPEAFHQPIVERQLTLEEAVEFADLRDADSGEFSSAVTKLEKGFASGAAVLVRGAIAKAANKARVEAAVAAWKARGWDMRVDGDSRDLPEGVLQIKAWTGVRWTPADHEATHCEHGVVYIQSSWMANVESWGSFYCLKPDNHADRIAEVEAAEAARAGVRQVVEETNEQRKYREAREALDASLEAASEARRTWLLWLMADVTAKTATARGTMTDLAADLATLAMTGDMDEDITSTVGERVEIGGLPPTGAAYALALHALLAYAEGAVPMDGWEYDTLIGDSTGQAAKVMRRYFAAAQQAGFILADVEQQLLVALDSTSEAE